MISGQSGRYDLSAASAGRLIRFHGSDESGQWLVNDVISVAGTTIDTVRFVRIGEQEGAAHDRWTLSAFVSNLRYTTSEERRALQDRQSSLSRSGNRCAVLIPIRKSAAWWMLAQDERRAIYARSNHTPIGLDYLPAIARQLHHCRDIGEPFDFLTWFEFAEGDTERFSELLKRLRDTEEWTYVDREVEVWLTAA